MKLTQSQLIQLVQSAGLKSVEVVEDEAQSEFNLDDGLNAIDKSRKSIFEPQLEKDLTENLEKQISGKMLGTIRSMLSRASGLSNRKLEEAMQSSGEIEDMVKTAFKHKESTMESAGEDVQKRVNELIEAHTKEKEALTQEFTQKITEAEQKYIDRDINEYLYSNVINKSPLPSTADKLLLTSDFKKHLRDKYNLSYNEAEKMLDLMDKGNAKMPALNGSVKVDIMNEAQQYFSARGQWQTDNRNENPAKLMENAKGTEDYKPVAGKRSADPITKANNARQDAYKQMGLPTQ